VPRQVVAWLGNTPVVAVGRESFVAVVGSKLGAEEQSMEGPGMEVSFQGNFLIEWSGKCCEWEALTVPFQCN